MSVSIVIPCYHVAPYVEECLQSLVNQTLRDIEIICVDDGSTDATPELLEAWARKDGRIRVIHCNNGGPGAARNAGLDAAKGDFIGFVDPDDYVEPSMFARLLEEARTHHADVTVCGYTGFSDRDGTVLEKWSGSPAAGVEEEMQSCVFCEDAVWKRTEVVVWNKLYRKDFLDRHGLRFEPSFRKGEDDVFLLMLLAHVNSVAVIPDRLYWYRRHREDSISYEWEEQGCPCILDMERLIHATVYWRKSGWLDSGLERGWVRHALWYYLLGRLLATNAPLPALTTEEWTWLHDKCRGWFSMVGGMDRLRNLDKWETAFCRLLCRRAEDSSLLARAWWKLLSRRRGRRGRYYALKLLLSGCRRATR